MVQAGPDLLLGAFNRPQQHRQLTDSATTGGKGLLAVAVVDERFSPPGRCGIVAVCIVLRLQPRRTGIR